jgi:hypothetical protein
MNMKSSAASKKKMTMMPRGFMCHSQAATAVCVSSVDAAHSAIVPAARNTRMINNARYSRLVESRRFVNPADHGKKPVTLSSMIKKETSLNHHHHQHSKVKMSLQKTPQVLPSADNVFQVIITYLVTFYQEKKTTIDDIERNCALISACVFIYIYIYANHIVG